MGDFLTFRRMITPIIIQILFWLGVIVWVGGGIYAIATAHNNYLYGYQGYVAEWNKYKVAGGIAAIILGPIMVRVVCEWLILFFRMNETLTDIMRMSKSNK